jgi:hypothetical protein
MAEEVPQKRGRGRPPGSKNKATLIREMESTIAPPRMFHGNCFDIMADDELIPTGSVNLVLCDPPFGCTDNDWDKPGINPYSLTRMWECYERVLSPKGVVVLFACVSVVRRTFPHPDPTRSRHAIATFGSRKRESRYRARQHDVDSGRHAERPKQIHTLGRKNPPLAAISSTTTAYKDTPERAEIVEVTANDTAE